MRHFHTLLCILTVTLALSACASVKKVDYAAPLSQPEDAHPAPIAWSGMKVKLPTGKDIGTIAHNSAFIPFCGLPIGAANRSFFVDAIDSADLKDTFRDTLESQGYDVTGSLDFQFPEDFEDEEARAEYKVGARVTDVQISACYTEPYLGSLVMNQNGFQGEMYLKIEWSLYDALHRNVVLKTTSEGYSKRYDANQEGMTLMINEAFAMAAHNLAADHQFHDAVFFGTRPVIDGLPKPAFKEVPHKYNPDEAVTIDNPPLSTDPFPNHAENSRKAAVMVQVADGFGSGFFITKQGHILTNAHVVGNAQRVRILTADKKDAIVGEVLRKNKTLDVALIKLEEIPDDLDIVTFPIRTRWPEVSEDVYAIGTPLKSSMQDTITKGIVSAHRMNHRLNGARTDLIQADVSMQAGNSGGPLLDRYGNLVAIADSGLATENGITLSLNLFVPIEKALQVLKIDLNGTTKP